MNIASSLFGPKDNSKAEATRRIKQWVASLQVLPEDGIVHVAELQCHEPDCPDFETVITLMTSDPKRDRTVKVLKPVKEVTHDDVVSALLAKDLDANSTPCAH